MICNLVNIYTLEFPFPERPINNNTPICSIDIYKFSFFFCFLKGDVEGEKKEEREKKMMKDQEERKGRKEKDKKK